MYHKSSEPSTPNSPIPRGQTRGCPTLVPSFDHTLCLKVAAFATDTFACLCPQFKPHTQQKRFNFYLSFLKIKLNPISLLSLLYKNTTTSPHSPTNHSFIHSFQKLKTLTKFSWRRLSMASTSTRRSSG